MALTQAPSSPGCERCNAEACTPTPVHLLEGSHYRRILPASLVELTSDEGKKRFAESFASGTAESFFPLVSQYQTQSHPAFCGLTTLTIILNTLAIDPARVWMHPWRWFTEAQLDCCVELDSAKTGGITMDQLAQVGRCNGADVRVLRGLTENSARALLLDAVRQNESFVAVSYSRKALGQTGSGHYSPVAAFDKTSDSVLILDTARFKYGPYWVAFKDLFAATHTVDKETGKPRGFLSFKKCNVDADGHVCGDHGRAQDRLNIAHNPNGTPTWAAFFSTISQAFTMLSPFNNITDTLSCVGSETSEQEWDMVADDVTSSPDGITQQELDRRIESSPVARYTYSDNRFR